jgi:hypothetical protein
VGEYVVELSNDLDPPLRRLRGLGAPMMTERLWEKLNEFNVTDFDLLNFDCEGAEYTILETQSSNGHLAHVGWIRPAGYSLRIDGKRRKFQGPNT